MYIIFIQVHSVNTENFCHNSRETFLTAHKKEMTALISQNRHFFLVEKLSILEKCVFLYLILSEKCVFLCKL